MRPIRMVDLQLQYQKIKEEIDKAIADILETTAFIKGPQIAKFEQELGKYLGVKHVIGCANGTDALMIALMALDLKPGDEVITPAFTFIATVETIAFLGLKPVLSDVDPDTFNIDCSQLEKLVTPRTKAIIPVHLFGQCSNMSALGDFAKNHSLYVIEDTAQANGSDYLFNNRTSKKAGTIGHIGCTSFFPSKNLGCYGDGGAMMTNDDKLNEKLRCIANHGMMTRYYHDMLGVNSRLDTIQAAILSVKLKYLDSYNLSRQKAAQFYTEALKGIDKIKTPDCSSYSTHIYHQYTLRISGNKRNSLKEYLDKADIPSMIYYPVPLHLQKAFSHLEYIKGDFPISELLSDEVLSLPMHTELDSEQLTYIVMKIKEFFN
jgi:UDP-2-acetamido-2-deoxy-ribo-hexuluronate aminotransferase